jgi:hypothetical protein
MIWNVLPRAAGTAPGAVLDRTVGRGRVVVAGDEKRWSGLDTDHPR